jgi:hypothetical protein
MLLCLLMVLLHCHTPDGVHRGLISEIIARFERKGYKLVGIKVMVPSQVRTVHLLLLNSTALHLSLLAMYGWYDYKLLGIKLLVQTQVRSGCQERSMYVKSTQYTTGLALPGFFQLQKTAGPPYQLVAHAVDHDYMPV